MSLSSFHCGVFVLGVSTLVGCKKGSIDVDDIPDDASTGTLRIDIGGDATAESGDEDTIEGDVEEVWIRIDQVGVQHEEEGWIIMSDERTDIDLMSLRDGDQERIASGDVYEGAYAHMRFVITDAWILAGGEEHDLDIEGDFDRGSNELELDVAYFVDADTVTDLSLGWDLDSQLRGSDDNWSLKSDVDVDVDVDAAVD
jgi:hypothetical protein